ncbi:unnamed protein product, partial [marine sediment metagenome]
MLANASPLKPSVDMLRRSELVLILLVVCDSNELAVVMFVCSLMGTESISLKAVLAQVGGQEAINPDYEI